MAGRQGEAKNRSRCSNTNLRHDDDGLHQAPPQPARKLLRSSSTATPSVTLSVQGLILDVAIFARSSIHRATWQRFVGVRSRTIPRCSASSVTSWAWTSRSAFTMCTASMTRTSWPLYLVLRSHSCLCFLSARCTKSLDTRTTPLANSAMG